MGDRAETRHEPVEHSRLSRWRRAAARVNGFLIANRFPLALFGFSRFALFLLAYLSLIFLPTNPGLDGWQAFPDNLFLNGWVRWDSGWYFDIATTGYQNEPLIEQQTDIVFFPLYPLVIRAVQTVVGDTYLAGLIVSNVAFLLALLFLYHLVTRYYGIQVARRTLLLLVAYPFSFYFSAMYTESLFLLTVVAAFYFGERRQWWLAGLCAAFASATRIVGILTVLGLFVLYLEQINFDWRKIRRDIFWLPLGLVGLASFMFFQTYNFGDPLLFIKNQYVSGWAADATVGDMRGVFAQLSPGAIATGRFDAINLLHILLIPVMLVLAGLSWNRPRIAYAVWGIATILASLGGWRSTGRYAMIIFPIFIVAALLLKRQWLYHATLYLSVLLLALFSILYTHFYWVS